MEDNNNNETEDEDEEFIEMVIMLLKKIISILEIENCFFVRLVLLKNVCVEIIIRVLLFVF